MISIIRRLGSPAIGAARVASACAAVPARATAAALSAPRLARRDPASQQLLSLRDDGWHPAQVILAPRHTEVRMYRGDEQRSVTGDTLAFAAYSSLAGLRAGATVERVPA